MIETLLREGVILLGVGLLMVLLFRRLGLGAVLGYLIGGVLIGLFGSWSALYIGDRWVDVVIFSILVIVLVFRPTGLLGEQSVARA